jgi:hypothetical protein
VFATALPAGWSAIQRPMTIKATDRLKAPVAALVIEVNLPAMKRA